MKFYIEFEIPPFRMIDTTEINADNKEKAIAMFKISHPTAKIRLVEGYHD